MEELPMSQHSRPSLLLLTVSLFAILACRQPSPAVAPVTQTPPVKDPAPPEVAPADSFGIIVVQWPDEQREGWLRIERIREGAENPHATGRFVRPNKLIIETHGVDQFTINLRAIPIDWSRRVVLRINDDPSELTRKHYPRLRLRRSPTGGWLPVKD